MIPWLQPGAPFPPVARALKSPNGLLCAGGDLSPERLLQAYAQGIFPWFSEGEPILWWSPDPRMVLVPGALKVSRSLRKTVARGAYEVKVDSAFTAVMQACAAPRDGQPGTWITAGMVAAYTELHRRGFAHSIECWQDGALVGGLYGLQLGDAFFGESMFSRAPDASKVALVHLVARLGAMGCRVIDCQQATPHLASLGAGEIPRAAFVRLLSESIQYPPSARRWSE